MSQESLVYLVNLIIGAILAGLVTLHWRQSGRGSNLGYWMVAAWIMTAADALFAARGSLPYGFGRLVPPLCVTLGHSVLLLGAQKTAERPPGRGAVVAIVLIHAALLAVFLLTSGLSQWRMVINGLIWGGLSLASYLVLRRAPAAHRAMLFLPALVFLLHGAFHGLRVSAATVLAFTDQRNSLLQVVGDLEVSFFMVALFVSLLLAHLQRRHAELQQALGEVKTLSGLLPLCAWCRKVRSDDGYWQQLEQYFESHSQVKFTHGICEDCGQRHFQPVATRVK